MKITFEDGSYGKGDKIVLVDGKKITFWEFADMIVNHSWIRDMEGQPLQGLINMINESMTAGEVTKKILDNYYHTKTEEDLARIAVELYKNEERINPRSDGNKSGEYFRDFLNDCFGAQEVTDEILDNYGLNARPY